MIFRIILNRNLACRYTFKKEKRKKLHKYNIVYIHSLRLKLLRQNLLTGLCRLINLSIMKVESIFEQAKLKCSTLNTFSFFSKVEINKKMII